MKPIIPGQYHVPHAHTATTMVRQVAMAMTSGSHTSTSTMPPLSLVPLRSSLPVSPWSVFDSRCAPAIKLTPHIAHPHATDKITEGKDGSEDTDTPRFLHVELNLFDLNWVFVGTTDGEAVLVGDTHGLPKFFAVVWVRDLKIVGMFLEGGTADHTSTLLRIPKETPRIVNIKKLRKIPLEELLKDIHCLTPPKLDVGEFVAEMDEDEMLEVFRYYDTNGTLMAKAASLGPIMAALGDSHSPTHSPSLAHTRPHPPPHTPLLTHSPRIIPHVCILASNLRRLSTDGSFCVSRVCYADTQARTGMRMSLWRPNRR